jgi:hypothetical protein
MESYPCGCVRYLAQGSCPTHSQKIGISTVLPSSPSVRLGTMHADTPLALSAGVGVATRIFDHPCGCPRGNASLYSSCPIHNSLTITRPLDGVSITGLNERKPSFGAPILVNFSSDATHPVSTLGAARPVSDYGPPVVISPMTPPAPSLDLATKKDVQTLAAMVETLIERTPLKAPKRPRRKRQRKQQAPQDEGERWVLEELLQENDSLRAEKAQLTSACEEKDTEIRLLRLNAKLGWGTEPYPDLEKDDFDPD